ncbi:MAG TPA: Gfo/Idh/MocA family oxidoreductase [Bryobacteraceae bacterium]
MPDRSRRDFLKNSAAGTLFAAPGLVRGSQANSALTLGVIGYGNRGSYVSGLFAKNENVKVAAICDIYPDKLEAAAAKYAGVAQYRDHKELLASGVDAVLIATPAFLHPEHFEAAVAARKHIFMEKPAGVNAAGCRRVTVAAKKADPTKRITVDYQQRYGKDYRKAYELVKSGDLGSIQMIRAAWFGGGSPIKTGHPAGQERIRNWFFYRDLSGDILVEQDCHNVDVINWFTGRHPVRVSGYGTQRIRKYGDVYDSLAATFQFDDGLVFSFSANQFRTPGFTEVGETFICDKGAVNVSRKGYTIWRGQRPPETVPTTYDITEDNVREFVEGCLNGKLENAAFSAVESTLTAVMGVAAIVKGQPVTWDEINRT